MADNTTLCYESSRQAGDVRRELLLPYPFHLLDVALPTAANGVNKIREEANNDTSFHADNREYFNKFPYTPMPPEQHGYIKANKYDPY